MSNKGLYTSGSTAVSAKVDSIPLTDAGVTRPGQDSIGTLISNATEQVSTLVRGEIELAKAEIIGEAKKGAIGGGMFAVAGVIALYSTFFLFFALAEMLASWMHRGWAFLIVFLIMLALAGLLAFIGFQNLRKIKAPERTIESVNELKNLVPGQAQENLRKDESGLYTTAPVAAPAGQRTAVRDTREVRETPETRTTARAIKTQQASEARPAEVREVQVRETRRQSPTVARKNNTRPAEGTTGGSTAVTRD